MPPLNPTTTTTTTTTTSSSFTLNNTLPSIPQPDKHLTPTPTPKRNRPLLRRKSTIHHLRHWLSQHLPTNPSPSSPGSPSRLLSRSKSLRKPTYHRSSPPPTPPPHPREPQQQQQHCNPDSKSETDADTFSTTISTSSSRSSSPTPSTENLGVEYEAYCRAFSSGLTAESYAYADADPHHHPLATLASDYRRNQHYPHAEAPAAAAAAAAAAATTTQPTRATTTTTTTTPRTRPSRRKRPWRIDEIRRPEDVRMLSGGYQHHHHHYHHQHERDHHPPDRHDRPDSRDSDAEPALGLIDPARDTTAPTTATATATITTANAANITPKTQKHIPLNNPDESKDIEQSYNTTTKKSDQAPEPNPETTTTDTTTPTPVEEQAPLFPPPPTTPTTQTQTQEILHWLRHRSSRDSIDRQAFEQHRYLHEGDPTDTDTDADADTDADTGADTNANTNTDRQTHAAAAHGHRHPPRLSPPLRVLTPARYEQRRKHATPQPLRKPWWGTVQSYWARMRPRSEVARREARREKQEADL
ncbi:hypothetical protein BO86DRAFT_393103 [Aspergillus japonicus CBS 114.51]|uniref:Uncharacterized protein n=1 Tax=Aspergillus japonicus CBS 114.51 TaxID=1448312 RepID=A0A8T8WN61_ASPJA|nr:hypothetical protein BO86DRAFT_393103 [Aspergillus japonicus CBS 114.51]RAH76849.1 hypothetical protein BO86DRAFT_393103 [Aspergillus japonicus CBS 114.51]